MAAERDRRGATGPLMDIVIQNELPTAAEREAVDAVLGPPRLELGGRAAASASATSAWRAAATRRGRSGTCCCPTLHAVQSRVGWISRGALNYVCRRLTIPPAEAYGVASFYALFSLEPQPPVVAHVCTDVACIARGSQELVAELERRVGPEGEHPGNGQAVWHESPCLGMCEHAPAAMLTVAGEDAARGVRRAGRRPTTSRAMLAGGEAPASAAAARPAGRRPGAAAAAPRRRRRPGRASTATAPTAATRRCAPRSRWGPTACCARSRTPSSWAAAAPRSRRAQVGGGRAQRQAPALPDLQRRRVRAGHVQGPRDPRGRPVRRSSRR